MEVFLTSGRTCQVEKSVITFGKISCQNHYPILLHLTLMNSNVTMATSLFQAASSD